MCDPEMHQAKEGSELHFGIKARISVDTESGLTRTLPTSPANTADVDLAHERLHGDEKLVFGDGSYQGFDKRDTKKKAKAYLPVARRPGKRRARPNNPMGLILEKLEQLKASVRAKVEHPFHIIKNVFGLGNVRYRGLTENTARLYKLFGLANLVIAVEKAWYDSRPNCVLFFQDGTKYLEKAPIARLVSFGRGRYLTSSDRWAARF
jgi:IS5 family transposase